MRGPLLELAQLQIADRRRESEAESLARFAGSTRSHSPRRPTVLGRFSKSRRRPIVPAA